MNNANFPQALSLEEYLARMSEKPWTFGWDALLVFDRNRTNILLMQEYIDRLGTDKGFPVFEPSEIDVAEGIKHALIGLTLDKPRLSFETASIASSKAAVTLRMVGGKQLQLNESYHDGEPINVVTRLSTLNAIVGPSLIFDSKLESAAGSVGEAGAVVLKLFQDDEDIKYRFTGVETEFERLKLGAHLGQLMGKWAPELTQLTLSELRDSDDSVLHPERFSVRTHAAPDAKVRGTPAYGDGAVVLFVAMKGSPNGTLPDQDADMLYMLPSSADNYSSNLILAQDLIWHKVLKPAISEVPWVQEAKFEDREIPGSRHRQLVATAGEFSHEVDYQTTLAKCELPRWSVPFHGENGMRFTVSGNNLVFLFKSGPYYNEGLYAHRDHPGNGWWTTPFKVKWTVDVEVVFRFAVEMEGDNPVIKLFFDREHVGGGIELIDYKGNENVRGYILNHLKWKQEVLDGAIENLITPLRSIAATLDAFRLNNLLFRGDNVVTPDILNLPGDLTVLGHLSPQRTDLVIEPAEVVVAGEGSLQFESSLLGDITWHVANVDGEEGDPGSIDIFTGLYKAPSAESLRDSGFRRVIVTATREDKVSKAMVSLVESSVSVYPSVVVVALGHSHSLVAGQVNNAALDWTLKQEDLGTLEQDPDKDPTMQDGYTFTAATKLPKPGTDDPYNFYAARLAEVEVSSADGSSRTIDVLVTANKSGNYWVEASAVGAGVQLRFYRTTLSEDKEEVPAASTHWHKYKGDGTFENGLYTPKAGSAEQYAIVTAFYYDGESTDRFAYMIIPVPFVSSQRFVELLGTTQEQ